MSKSSVKSKVILLWSNQTEKLKQRLASLTDKDLYFEKEKMEEVFRGYRGKLVMQNTSFLE